MIRFGPAGNSESFYEEGYKSSQQAPEYLAKKGLNAYEYQCGRGVNIGEESAREIGALATERDIQISLHAPYYISLSSVKEQTRLNSLNYIIDSAKAVDWMGGTRIIVHSGTATKMTREEALALAGDTLTKARQHLDDNGYEHIVICPETMGKLGQLGTLEEVISLCQVDERMLPCIDFGHLNARTFGAAQGGKEYETMLTSVKNGLGSDRVKMFHSHFSKIEYTEKGGEVRHLTFEDKQYGPEFEPLAELCYKWNLTPTFICESAGTQAEDAVAMRDMYLSFAK